MSTTTELRVIHDRLLEVIPDGAEHCKADCALCAVEATEDHDRTPGGVMPETFTQDELDAAVAAASGSLQQRLAELEAQVQETEVGRAVTEAVAAKETAISELQQQLDAAVAARTTAEAELTETKQYWSDAIAAQEAAVELAARAEDRTAKAKELGVFSDEYIAENAERFASMTDEDFSARIEEWQLIASKREPVGFKAAGPNIPTKTALVASRADATKTGSHLSVLTDLRARQVDPRTLVGGQ
jgi:multidrug efflux pump subunit AcrA (membrane-fusion protein)